MARSTQLPRNPRDAERAISTRLLTEAGRRAAHIEDPKEFERARGTWVQRLRRELAYRRFLARLFGSQPDSWVLKGGVSLLFRLDPNRPSYDIDIAYVAAGVEHAVAVRQLRAAISTDLGDMFDFELGEPREMTDEVGAITVPVIVRIGAKEFSRFNIDMPLPREGVPSEPFDLAHTGIGFDELDAILTMRVLPLEHQLADKVCAMFERHGDGGRIFSTRSRDLADIALVASQKVIDGSVLRESLEAEAERRASKRLQNGLPVALDLPDEQLEHWKITWDKNARKAPIAFDEALVLADLFLGPVLASKVDGLHWQPLRRVWASET